MATTQNTFTGNGSNLGPFSFTFKWLESTDIKVTVGGVLKTAGTHYNLQSLNYTTKTGGQVLFTAGNAPANGASIRIYRDTDDESLSAVFSSGSAIRAKDLNDNFTQNLYVTQETNNNAVNIDGSNPMVGPLNMNGFQIDNLAEPTTDSDAATKKYIDDRYGNLDIPGHTRWRKVATASQTTFSGTGDYGGVLAYSATREQVYINGALQQRAVDYTADNGTSVVFTVGLTVGDVVDIICVNNLTNSAVSNAGNITYSGQFSGQSARTVAAKLGDAISVKDFGAVGDGVANDTVAIQTAINYCFTNSVNTLIIPHGNYKITDTLLAGDYDASQRGNNFGKLPNITGIGLPILKYSGPANKACLRVGAPGNGSIATAVISNLFFQYDGTVGNRTGTIGLHAQASHYVTYSGIQSDQFDIAVLNAGSIGCTFDFCRRIVRGVTVSLKIVEEPDAIIGLRANDTSYINAQIRGIGGNTTGIDAVRFGGCNTFDNCVIEGDISVGFKLTNGGEVINPGSIHWDRTYMKSCWFEAVSTKIGEITNTHLEMHNCFFANGIPIHKKDAFSKLYIKGCSSYNGTLVLVDNNLHAENIYIDEIPFAGLPHSLFPWNPAIQNAEPEKLLYVTPQSYKVEYSSQYPAGNNDYNGGLALDVGDICTKMFGRFILARVCFVGSDGGPSNILEVTVAKAGSTPSLLEIKSNNAFYSISGSTITFTGLPSTGGWFKLKGIYRKEA